MTDTREQRIKWTKIGSGIYWGVAPIGLAYRIERANRVEGVQFWDLKEFPNEDAEVGEYVDTGAFACLKRVAELEASCHAANISSEAVQ